MNRNKMIVRIEGISPVSLIVKEDLQDHHYKMIAEQFYKQLFEGRAAGKLNLHKFFTFEDGLKLLEFKRTEPTPEEKTSIQVQLNTNIYDDIEPENSIIFTNSPFPNIYPQKIPKIISLNKLILYLTDPFQKNEQLLRCWFVNYRTFITPFQLLMKFCERYETPNALFNNWQEPMVKQQPQPVLPIGTNISTSNSTFNNAHSLMERSWYNVTFKIEVKRKVCEILIMFITDYFFDFNDEMVSFLEDFANDFLKRDGFGDYAAVILKKLKNSENRKPPWAFFEQIDWSKKTTANAPSSSSILNVPSIPIEKKEEIQNPIQNPITTEGAPQQPSNPPEIANNAENSNPAPTTAPQITENVANPVPNPATVLPSPNAALLAPNAVTNLTTVPPEKLAEQLTYMDYTFYSYINWTEISEQSWAKEKKQYRAPYLLRFIQFLNKISNLVAFYVCSEKDDKKRINLCRFFLKVLSSLLELNSVSMVQAIFSGLNSTAVYRLSNTWDAVDEKTMALKKPIENLTSSKGNFKNIRALYENCYKEDKPCSPFVGTLLTDYTFSDDGNPEKIDGKINFYKCCLLYSIIQNVLRFQGRNYAAIGIQPDLQVINAINSFEVVGEKEMYQMSLGIQPRGTGK